ncbi:hypothetical protein [Kribbella sp. NPDC023855]|uniref:hypothetical protein n=1 Tax=Kribbella sp. NPDC023855 TaxID=3154698 RepID=UPI0033C426D0
MSEPKFPQYARPTPGYPLTEKAEARQRSSVADHGYLIAAGAIFAVIVMVVAYVVYRDATATRAADTAAVVVTPTVKPGAAAPQRTKPVEYSPKLSDHVKGDGTWLIGKEIKRGTYRSEGGEWCFWERLRDLSGEPEGVMSKGFVNGPQVVAIGPDDVAFSSQGCGQWVMLP